MKIGRVYRRSATSFGIEYNDVIDGEISTYNIEVSRTCNRMIEDREMVNRSVMFDIYWSDTHAMDVALIYNIA